MEENKRTRQTAYKVPISVIISGNYVKEDETTPNYIQYEDLKISRANIMAVLVSKMDEGNIFAILDDGSGEISIRGFEENDIDKIKDINIGDIINVIGRPREFNNEKYIVPEIIKKIDEKWIKVRKLEVAYLLKKEKNNELSEIENQKEGQITEESIVDDTINTKPPAVKSKSELAVEYIRKNDSGQGVDIDQMIKESNIENCEKLIENMLKEGELFENMPGKIKILE